VVELCFSPTLPDESAARPWSVVWSIECLIGRRHLKTSPHKLHQHSPSHLWRPISVGPRAGWTRSSSARWRAVDLQ